MNLLQTILTCCGVLWFLSLRGTDGTKCHVSIDGIALVDHVMTSFVSKHIDECFKRCSTKLGCLSINFYVRGSLCELNNGTIENTPNKKVQNNDAVYFQNPDPSFPLISDILRDYGNTTYYQDLMKFLVPVLQSNHSGWTRCWRAITDGWDVTKTFHPHCDNKGPTVTLVRDNKFIFGGYSDVSWDSSSGNYAMSTKAFLFSLYNIRRYHPLKFKVRNSQVHNAVYRRGYDGPTFGGGHDLYINNNANTNSYNNWFYSSSYISPPDCFRSQYCPFYTGNGFYTPSDVEVFFENTN